MHVYVYAVAFYRLTFYTVLYATSRKRYLTKQWFYNESKAIFRNLDTWVRDTNLGFSGDWDSKEAACNAGVMGLFPGLGRSSGERNGNPLQYSCLENPMSRGVLWATVCEVARVGARVGHDLDHHHHHLQFSTPPFQ